MTDVIRVLRPVFRCQREIKYLRIDASKHFYTFSALISRFACYSPNKYFPVLNAKSDLFLFSFFFSSSFSFAGKYYRRCYIDKFLRFQLPSDFVRFVTRERKNSLERNAANFF